MDEYRIKGLTCANCTRELEEKIQKLDAGSNAKLNYNTGKLLIDKNANLDKVKKILQFEGASIEEDGESNEDQKESQNEIKKIKGILIASTLVYLLAILLDNRIENYIVISLYLLAMILSGYKTFIKGFKNLINLTFNIDTLMTIALTGAIAIGQWKEATLVAILFGVNALLEGLGMEKARKSMESLLKVAPKEATLIENGLEKMVPISSLHVNDIVLVRPGEKIPSDGIVIEGKSSVNESAITGESLPIEKAVEEPVFGGSINNEGILKIKIQKAYEDSSLAKILHLVKEAQSTKTPTELFINRFAKYYTPIIIVVAILVTLIPPLFFQGEWTKWIYQGLSVLIVGCPCALIISSPIAIISGIARNAKNGILIKGGAFLEELGKVDTIAFDKTGTLTSGEPYVEKTIVFDQQRFYTIVASIEKSSSHPLAKAIMNEMDRLEVHGKDPDEIQTVSGRGIVAKIDGINYWMGNENAMNHLQIPEAIKNEINQLKKEGLTLVLVSDKDNILGMFGIEDKIREESKDVIRSLHKMGIRNTVMLTGDHKKTAEKVGKYVGVTSYYSDLLPEEKVQLIQMFRNQGKVAMIGDGINDAPALASANLGIAMGKGTDSAIETADIVLMQDHLGRLPSAISISRKVNRMIKLNISIALGLKIMALLLTIPGLLTLWIAILSDMGATVLVTLISLTILWKTKDSGSPSFK